MLFYQADLSKKHGVRGIPTLVILNAETGAVITNKGTFICRHVSTKFYASRSLALSEIFYWLCTDIAFTDCYRNNYMESSWSWSLNNKESLSSCMSKA